MAITKTHSIKSTLKNAIDYICNPAKTDGNLLVSTFGCAAETADIEFAWTRKNAIDKGSNLGRHLIQAFEPGETSPEQAHEIGMLLANEILGGKYEFVLTTHIDRQQIHNHIYYNSTSLDCTRKFRDFLGSAFALRRLSDRVCLEHGLSVIRNPKQHSKGRHKHYGEWQEAANDKPLTFQEKLCLQINKTLAQNPAGFADFLSLMEGAGYEVKAGRGGAISFRLSGASAGHASALGPAGPSQMRFTRLRASTLGEGYSPEDIKARLAGGGDPHSGPPRRLKRSILSSTYRPVCRLEKGRDVSGPPQSRKALWGEEEQWSEADAHRKVGAAERSL